MTYKTAARAASLWLVSAAALAATAPLEVSTSRAQAMLVKEDLGGGIYVFRAPEALDYWTSTNSVVLVNADDLVVFDSCTHAVTARAVIAEIRKLTSRPVRVLINSHWHQDHWSGNDAYAKAYPGRLRLSAPVRTSRGQVPEAGARESEGNGVVSRVGLEPTT